MLPADLAREAGPELTQMFAAAHARAARRGRLALAALWIRASVDLVAAAAAERLQGPRQGPYLRERRPMRLLMTRLAADLAAGSRRLRAAPGGALFAAATLALGLGAAVATFALVRDILLEPLLLHDPGRLVRLREQTAAGGRFWPSFPNCADWEARATASFSALGCASIPVSTVVATGGTSVLAEVARGTAGLFRALGVQTAAGRLFSPGEHQRGGSPVALVSGAFWRRHLGARPLDGLAMTIGLDRVAVVGVLPDDFRFLGDGSVWTQPDIWTPLERDPNLGGRRSHGYHTVGRLRVGVGMAEADRNMATLTAQLAAEHREATHADRAELRPLTDVVVQGARAPLRLLAWAAAGVLIVACLNFAATMLARGLSRAHELSVRMSLGARRVDVVRLLVAEALVVALPAAAAGLVIGAAAVRTLRSWHPGMLPRLADVRLDAGVVMLAVGLALAAAVVAGCLPALALSPRALSRHLTARSDAGASRHRHVWNVALALQVGASLVLLIGTGLLVRSFSAALGVDLGYRSANVISVAVSLPEGTYASAEARRAFVLTALDRLRQLPSSAGATLTNALPHITETMTSGTRRADDEAGSVFASQRVVTSEFFDVLGIPIVQRQAPLDGTRVYVDASLARRFWPDGLAAGSAIRAGFADGPVIVGGVVGSVREWNQNEGDVGAVYYDYERSTFDVRRPFFLVRHRGEEQPAVSDIRAAIAGIDGALPLQITSLDAHLIDALQERRAVLDVVGAFGVIGLAIAAAGVYALVAFAVGRRLREAAIRKAIGARPSQVAASMVRFGLVPTAAGLLLGALAWIPASGALRALLFQVTAYDPLTLVTACVSLGGAAALAAVIPARRAARVEPLALLRDQ